MWLGSKTITPPRVENHRRPSGPREAVGVTSETHSMARDGSIGLATTLWIFSSAKASRSERLNEKIPLLPANHEAILVVGYEA